MFQWLREGLEDLRRDSTAPLLMVAGYASVKGAQHPLQRQSIC